MLAVVVADLHLTAEASEVGFDEEKEATFVQLVEGALAASAQVILAGDVLDLAALAVPREGLDAFYAARLPGRALPEGKSVSETVESIAHRWPKFFGALAKAAQATRLSWLPGNADCLLRTMEGQSVCASLLGSKIDLLRPRINFDGVLISHGHELDPSAQTEASCSNPAAVMASCLSHAGVPMVKDALSQRELAVLESLAPDRAVTAIADRLGPGRGATWLDGFQALLDRNGYFENDRPLSSILKSVPLFGALARSRPTFASPDRAELLRKSVRRYAVSEPITELFGGAPPRLVALAHAHRVDSGPGYVNIGAWVDRVGGFSDSDWSARDRALPVLWIEDVSTITLRDARRLREVGTLDRCVALWRWDATPVAGA